MKNYQWVPLIALAGAILLFYNHQRGIRQSGFDEGVECIMKGINRDEGNTPKMCEDYYSTKIKRVTELIERPEDTQHRKMVKPILKETLSKWYFLRENGAGDIIWKTK